MLAEMLGALNADGVCSTQALARRLGVSEGLVAAMSDDLIGRGYLAPMTIGCASGCGGCGAASRCAGLTSEGAAPRLLALTAKGRQAVQRGGDRGSPGPAGA